MKDWTQIIENANFSMFIWLQQWNSDQKTRIQYFPTKYPVSLCENTLFWADFGVNFNDIVFSDN